MINLQETRSALEQFASQIELIRKGEAVDAKRVFENLGRKLSEIGRALERIYKRIIG